MKHFGTKTHNFYTIKNLGYTVYSITVVGFILLMIAAPSLFDIRAALVPMVTFLLVGSLLFSQSIASKKSSKAVMLLGTVALAVMFTFIAFFVIAAVAWLIAVYHASI